MSSVIVFVVDEMAPTSSVLKSLIGALEAPWSDAAIRHRGILAPFSVVVSTAPTHRQLDGFIKITEDTWPVVKGLTCVVLPTVALCFLGPNASLSERGISYIEMLWPRLEVLRIRSRVGLWLAPLHGSRKIPRLRVEEVDITSLRDARFSMNMIIFFRKMDRIARRNGSSKAE